MKDNSTISDENDDAGLLNSIIEFSDPELYRQNGFRITELMVDAKPRDITRQIDKLKIFEKFMPAAHTAGVLPLEPSPDADAIRMALQRLRDPERRLIDEFFWFWPHKLDDCKNDEALEALKRGEIKTAINIWKKQESASSEAQVSVHNLAVIAHTIALDLEYKSLTRPLSDVENQIRSEKWKEAFRGWKALMNQEGFWSRLTARIRELDDPRLTTGVARRLRSSLPLMLLSINAQLALKAAEQLKINEVKRQLEVMYSWEQKGINEVMPQVIEKAIENAVKPLCERIKVFCKAADAESDADPAKANKVAERLFSHTKPIIGILDNLLPFGNSVRDGVHDEIALCALGCQIVYGNKTDDWKTCLAIIERIEKIAGGESARLRIERNIEIVKRNLEYGLCFFCKENPAEDMYGQTVPVHGEVNSTYTGYNTTRITWRHSEVKVPRCGICAKAHSRYQTARNLGPCMGILACILTIVGFGQWEGYFYDGSLMWLFALIAVLMSFLIPINLGLGVARVWIRGRKPLGEFHDFPALVDIKKRGWKYGSGPEAAWSGPNQNNPERGKLGNWEPFRKRILAWSGSGTLLLLYAPLICSLILYASVPLAGFIVGAPGGAWDFYRAGLLDKNGIVDRLGSVLAKPVNATNVGIHRTTQQWLNTILVSADTSDQSLLPALEKIAENSNRDICRAAVTAMTKISPSKTRLVLLTWLKGSNRMLNVMAAQLLTETGAVTSQVVPTDVNQEPEIGLVSEIVSTLITELEDNDLQVFKQAAESLGNLGPAARQAVPVLKKATHDRGTDIRQTAIDALEKIAPGSGISILIAELESDTWQVRQSAAQTLGDMGQTAGQAVPALKKAVHDNDSDVRRAAADAIEKIAPGNRISVLIAELESNDWQVRQSAAVTLGNMGPAAVQAVRALKRASHDDDSDVRQAAADALEKIEPETRISTLIAELESDNWQVRQSAAQALGSLGFAARQAVPALKKAANDNDSDVRQAASDALEKIAPGIGDENVPTVSRPQSGSPLFGVWREGRYEYKIQNVDGEPKVVSVIDVVDGEHFKVEMTSWKDGVLTWRYYVPSTGYRLTYNTLQISSDELGCSWSNNRNQSGTETLKKTKEITPETKFSNKTNIVDEAVTTAPTTTPEISIPSDIGDFLIVYTESRRSDASKVAERLKKYGFRVSLNMTSNSGNSVFEGKIFTEEGYHPLALRIAEIIADIEQLTWKCGSKQFSNFENNKISLWIVK